MAPSWLPDLIELSDCGGDWEAYLEKIYNIYLEDFHRRPFPMYGQDTVSAKKIPELEGKSRTFWHMTGDGEDAVKTPNLSRCSKIAWARAIIDNHTDPSVLAWRENNWSGGDRTIMWLKSCNYVVVLAHRNGYSLLWTAYETTYANTRRKLQARYDRATSA